MKNSRNSILKLAAVLLCTLNVYTPSLSNIPRMAANYLREKVGQGGIEALGEGRVLLPLVIMLAGLEYQENLDRPARQEKLEGGVR